MSGNVPGVGSLCVRAWIGSRLPRTPVGSRPTAVAPGQKVGWEVPLHSCGERIAIRPAVWERLRRDVSFHACSAGPRAGSPLCVCAPRWGLRAVSADGKLARAGGRSRLALRLLVLKWLHPTRLETRTKECNMRASLGVTNPSAQ